MGCTVNVPIRQWAWQLNPLTLTMGHRSEPTGLSWHSRRVQGRPASYAVGGDGLPVLFLHGWGLGHRAYSHALSGLAAQGCRVYAPSLPGFGGTAGLPSGARNIAGYAAWLDDFIEAVGLDEPAFVVGHSFGGGVGIRLAHDYPDRVRYLVLMNSVGRPGWTAAPAVMRSLAERPMWEWAWQITRDLLPSRDAARMWRAVSQDVSENLFQNPTAMWEIGLMASRADLTAELAELGQRNLPVIVLWSAEDRVIPSASFDALCTAIGADGRVVQGGHSWLLANPKAFNEVLDNVVGLHVDERTTTQARASAEELLGLLRGTSVPRRVAKRLVHGASPLWMVSEQPVVLAADLALCHPKLAPAEVRAVARPIDDDHAFRLTVAAEDRAGLLADTAAVLAAERLSILSASAATWDAEGLALHALTVDAPRPLSPEAWTRLGERLRSMAAPVRRRPFAPKGQATVTMTGTGATASIVKVTAPDQVGLLEAICCWFADQGVSIEAARVTTQDGLAQDAFVVEGPIDTTALAAHLSRHRLPFARRPRATSATLVS